MEDTFGELDDDRVRAELETRGRTTGAEAAARAGAANENLVRQLVGKKVMLITYSLPLSLSKDPVSGEWSARWLEDDFIARTSDSIADVVDTIWVGCVTNDCIAGSSADADSSGGTFTPSGPILFTEPAAGGVYNPRGAALRVPPVVAVEGTGEGSGIGGGTAELAGGGPARAGRSDTSLVPELLSEADMASITRACNALNALPIFLPSDLHEVGVGGRVGAK